MQQRELLLQNLVELIEEGKVFVFPLGNGGDLDHGSQFVGADGAFLFGYDRFTGWSGGGFQPEGAHNGDGQKQGEDAQ